LSTRAQAARSRVGRGWLALLAAAVGLAAAQGVAPIPKLDARVTDLTGTLTAEQQSALEDKLAAFEARKGTQIVVLIVPTTHPEEIEQYSIRVVEQWKIGRAHVDDGVMLIVAKNDRRVRIEVGYGLEGALPDAIANRIITETIRPLFAQNDFYGGINAGVDQIELVVAGEALPAPDRTWHGGGSRRGIGSLLPFLFIAIFIGSSALRAILGRPAGAIVTGGITGVIVWLFGGFIVAAVIASVVAFLFALLSGMGGGLARPGGFGGWGGGMIGGGLGGMGGGGGGFSGGGGGFGGGGASGGW
jgi:uncharacterized protein